MRLHLSQNLSLKILSLLLAVACWFVVRSEEDRVKDFAVPIDYVNLPASLDMSGPVVDTVAVRLRGPEPILRMTTDDRLSARVDLAHVPMGEQTITVTPAMIRAPGGVEVVRLSPDLIPIRLERRAKREVPVVAEFAGRPAGGFEKKGHQVVPSVVTIEGPAGEVARVVRATTGTILLEGESASYEVEATPVPEAPPGSRVHVVIPAGPVRVKIAIAPAGGGRRPE
jgi:YbbR domain-containing protein